MWLTIILKYKMSNKIDLSFCYISHVSTYMFNPLDIISCPTYSYITLRFQHKNDVRFVFTSSFCRRAHVLYTLLCLFARSGVKRILCCVFVVFFFVLWGPVWLNELGCWKTLQLIQAYHQCGVGSRPAL